MDLIGNGLIGLINGGTLNLIGQFHVKINVVPYDKDVVQYSSVPHDNDVQYCT